MANDTTSSAASGSGYEFGTEQNSLIGDTATKMKLVGLILIIFGFLNLLNAIMFQVLYVQMNNEQIPPEIRDQLAQISTRDRWIITGYITVVGVVFVFSGLWTRQAGGSFSEIVRTKGNDIAHLMSGFRSLNKMYSLLATVMVAAILAVVVLMVFKAVGIGGGAN
jgi:hypothetical protein